jgi:hypothetical protein
MGVKLVSHIEGRKQERVFKEGGAGENIWR